MPIYGKEENLNGNADFYNKKFTKEEYQVELARVVQRGETEYLLSDSRGFKCVGLIHRIIQLVKRLIGLQDLTEVHFVNSQLLKFLYYGEKKGYFDDLGIRENLVKVINDKNATTPLDAAIKSVAQDLLDKKSDFRKKIRSTMTQYHLQHRDSLRPGWLVSLLGKKLNIPTGEFGNVYLELAAKEALKHNYKAEKISDYVLEALTSNEEASFQRKAGQFVDGWQTRIGDKRIALYNLLVTQAIENKEFTDVKHYLSRLTDGRDLRYQFILAALLTDFEAAKKEMDHCLIYFSDQGTANTFSTAFQALIEKKEWTKASQFLSLRSSYYGHKQLFQLIEGLINAEKYDEALKALTSHFQYDPSEEAKKAFASAVELLIEKGQLETAFSFLQEGINVYTSDSSLFLKSIEKGITVGNFDFVQKVLTKAIREKFPVQKVQLKAVDSLLSKGELQKASDIIHLTFDAKESDYTQRYCTLIVTAYTKKKWDLADKLLEEAMPGFAQVPQLKEVFFKRAEQLIEEGQLSEARSLLFQGSSYYSAELTSLYAKLIEKGLEAGNYTIVRLALEKAIYNRLSIQEAHLNAVRTLLSKGELQLASDFIGYAVYTDNNDYYQLLGQLMETALAQNNFQLANILLNLVLPSQAKFPGTKNLFLRITETILKNPNDLNWAYVMLRKGFNHYKSDLQFQNLWHSFITKAIAAKEWNTAEIASWDALQNFPHERFNILFGTSLLLKGDSQAAKPYFEILEKAFANDGPMLHHLANAWANFDKEKQYALYEKLVPLYEKEQPKAAAQLAFALGEHYVNKTTGWGLFSKPDYPNAVRCYVKAYNLQKNNEQYKEKCLATTQKAVTAGAWSWNLLTKPSSNQLAEIYQMAAQLSKEAPGDQVNQVIAHYEEEGKIEEAIAFYEEMQTLWPLHDFIIASSTIFIYAEQLAKKEEYEKAVEYFKKAGTEIPTYLYPVYQKAYFEVAIEVKDPVEKESQLSKLYDTKLEKGPLLSELKEALFDVRVEIATTLEDKCRHSYDASPNATALEREKLRHHKQKVKPNAEQAVDWYLKALKIGPTDAKVHFNIAELYNFFDIDVNKALEHYNLAVQHDKENIYYHHTLAMCYSLKLDDKNCAKHNKIADDLQTKEDKANFTYFLMERFQQEKVKKFKISPHV